MKHDFKLLKNFNKLVKPFCMAYDDDKLVDSINHNGGGQHMIARHRSFKFYCLKNLVTSLQITD